jgi:RNA polymerase sigma-70 factor (ECF subfamily)
VVERCLKSRYDVRPQLAAPRPWRLSSAGPRLWNFSAVGLHYTSEVQDDGGLLERARKGDEIAFSQLFARYKRAIHRYASYMAGREAADDIVQETFLVVLRQVERSDRPRAPVLAYLVGIARRCVHRRLGSPSNVPFTDDDSERLDTGPGGGMTALEQLSRAETAHQVRAAVQSLPRGYREVVVLCDLQELDYAGAAEIMGCPVGTVRSRLHRARGLLATKLAKVDRGTSTSRE